jgi:hypothetical protein
MTQQDINANVMHLANLFPKLMVLAEAYCQSAQMEIEKTFKETGSNNDKHKLKLSKEILAGDLKWLEDNIVI